MKLVVDMRNRLLFLFLALVLYPSTGWTQRVYELEYYFQNYRKADFEIEYDGIEDEDTITYHVFDTRGVLNPYLGTWVGEYKDYIYEFFVSKKRNVKEGLVIDALSKDFNIYRKKPESGDLELVETTTQKVGARTRPMFMLEYRPTDVFYAYFGAPLPRIGYVYTQPKSKDELIIYMIEDSPGASEPVFPIWDGRLGKGETTMMYKVSDECPSGWNVLDGRRESNDDLYRDLQKFLLLSRLYGRGKLQVDYTDVALCEMILATHLYRVDYDEGKPFVKNGDERVLQTEDIYKFVFGSTYTNASSIQRQAYWYKLLRQMAMLEGMLKSKSVDERRSERVELVEVLGKEPLVTLRGYALHKGLSIEEVIRQYFQDAISLARESRMCDPDKFAEALAEDLFNAPMSYAELKRRVKL